MCRQNQNQNQNQNPNQNCSQLAAVEEEISDEERLLIYCKPVELYNILRRRFLHNPIFLSRNLDYKIEAAGKRKRVCGFTYARLMTYLTLNFGLATEEYQAVNVSVKINQLTCENVADGIDPRLQTFFFRSKSRKRARRTVDLNEKQASVQFLELDSSPLVGENLFSYEEASKSIPSENGLQNGRHGAENCCFDYPGVSIAMAHSPAEPECVKTTVDNVPSTVLQLTKAKKTAERSDPKNRMLLHRRQFYHSHRVQPMAMEQVMSDQDSEDELDDEIADFEDRRMLDDFVDVNKDEKQVMHLWNSFLRKQSVIADGHIPWACEAFSKLHGPKLVQSTALFWCWRLFMIKLWNHGLLDACTINNCNIVLEQCRTEGSDNASGSQKEQANGCSSKSTEMIQGKSE
ncbi:hypothetical protein ACFE04_027970 [Oxalis oulophora]